MTRPLSPQEWNTFRRHVKPGCPCRHIFADQTIEGLLLENWPYMHTEYWIDIFARHPDYDRATQEKHQSDFLCFQPIHTLGVLRGYLPHMRFWIYNHWYDAYRIVRFPGEA